MSQVTLKNLLAKLDLDEARFQWLGASCEGATANKKGDVITYKLCTEVPIHEVLIDRTKNAIVLWVDTREVNEIMAKLAAEPDGLQPFTVFCRQKDGKGTTWVDTVQAKDALHAAEVGLSACADDWEGYPREEIHVCGVATGDIDFTWNDPEV